MYEPEDWVIYMIEFAGQVHYRVLAGWRSGYMDGSSWRMNSGILKCVEHGDYYIFHGWSGSEYKCPKVNYRLSLAMAGGQRIAENNNAVLMEDRQDWTTFNWTEKEQTCP